MTARTDLLAMISTFSDKHLVGGITVPELYEIEVLLDGAIAQGEELELVKQQLTSALEIVRDLSVRADMAVNSMDAIRRAGPAFPAYDIASNYLRAVGRLGGVATEGQKEVSIEFEIAQLRHLYKQMMNGDVRATAEAARGLLGPAIEGIERYFAACSCSGTGLALRTA